MAEVQRKRRGNTSKKIGVDPRFRDGGDVNLVRYFRDITSFELLDSESEQEIAQRIAELEREEWRTCLLHPPVASAVVTALGRVYPQLRKKLAPLKRAHSRMRQRPTAKKRDSYLALVDRQAPLIKQTDQDREVLEELERWVLGDEFPLPGCTGREAGSLPSLRRSKALEQVQLHIIELKAEGRALRERFITSNLRLVIAVAKKQQRGTLSLNDLIQEGNIGLMKAVQRFDPDTGYRFSTYAIWWIRHAITRALADKSRTVRLPVHLIETHKKLQRVRTRYLVHGGREPTDKELARDLDVSMRKLRRLQRQSPDPSFSLDRELSAETPYRYIDLVRDEETPSPFEQVAHNDWSAELRSIVKQLPDIEAQIVKWRYGVGRDREMTLKQIGERYSLSRERIRQLQQQALWRMRQNVKGLY